VKITENDNLIIEKLTLLFLLIKFAFLVDKIHNKIYYFKYTRKIFQFIFNKYSSYKENTIIDNEYSKSLKIIKGDFQGCFLFPILFNFFIDDIFNSWNEFDFTINQKINSNIYILFILFYFIYIFIWIKDKDVKITIKRNNQEELFYSMWLWHFLILKGKRFI